MLLFNNSSSGYARLPHLSPTGEPAVWWDGTQKRTRVETIPAMSEIEKARRAKTVAPWIRRAKNFCSNGRWWSQLQIARHFSTANAATTRSDLVEWRMQKKS
jgi:hypothetical protein